MQPGEGNAVRVCTLRVCSSSLIPSYQSASWSAMGAYYMLPRSSTLHPPTQLSRRLRAKWRASMEGFLSTIQFLLLLSRWAKLPAEEPETLRNDHERETELLDQRERLSAQEREWLRKRRNVFASHLHHSFIYSMRRRLPAEAPGNIK